MYKYESEIIWTKTKWFSDKANEEDIAELDDRLNERSKDGWELATYDYMATSTQVKGAFVVTYKKWVEEL